MIDANPLVDSHEKTPRPSLANAFAFFTWASRAHYEKRPDVFEAFGARLRSCPWWSEWAKPEPHPGDAGHAGRYYAVNLYPVLLALRDVFDCAAGFDPVCGWATPPGPPASPRQWRATEEAVRRAERASRLLPAGPERESIRHHLHEAHVVATRRLMAQPTPVLIRLFEEDGAEKYIPPPDVPPNPSPARGRPKNRRGAWGLTDPALGMCLLADAMKDLMGAEATWETIAALLRHFAPAQYPPSFSGENLRTRVGAFKRAEGFRYAESRAAFYGFLNLITYGGTGTYRRSDPDFYSR